MPYIVYIVHCADNTYYTGITTNLTRRLQEHNGHTLGARYTKTRQPVRVVYQEVQPDRSSAQKREAEIKRLSRQEKIDLVQEVSGLSLAPQLFIGRCPSDPMTKSRQGKHDKKIVQKMNGDS